MALEIEGTLAQKLPVQSGNSARGPWAKQEFILEYPDGNFTAKACFTAWGQDKVQDLGKYQVGDKVKVSFNLKSREYNGRWYNDLQIWKIAPAGAQPAAPAQPAPQARQGVRQHLRQLALHEVASRDRACGQRHNRRKEEVERLPLSKQAGSSRQFFDVVSWEE